MNSREARRDYARRDYARRDYARRDYARRDYARRDYGGFTLVELLSVIGITAALAAILFPVFAGIRERGRRTQCLSNERQLGMAISQYVVDSSDKHQVCSYV